VLPRQAGVSRALGRTGYRRVTLDPTNRTVRFDRDGVELDPGGIGKGTAAHMAPTHRVFFCEDARPPACSWVPASGVR
jgi:thiamine biosynthesis lipoprotein ApbE